MNILSEPQRGHHHGDHHELVAIEIDKKAVELRPGEYLVTKLKELGKVPADFELDELVHGKLVPRPDKAKIHIKGGEIFVSHPKDAGSS